MPARDMIHRLAYVVPTKDRPDDLRVLFNSLQKQTVFPHQLIIVDGSDPEIKYVCDEYPDLPITYERCFPPSLAKQRNAGMARVRNDITLAGYLDDDLELDQDATEKMLQFWANAPVNTGGAAISIRNQPLQKHSRLMRLFFLTGKNFGQMLPSGFAVYIPYMQEMLETQWLYGGATVWSREVIKSFDYDEWYAGHGYLEDVDFSFRVGLKYRLFVVGDSRCLHHSDQLVDSQQYVFGKQQIFNRIYFVRKIKSFKRIYVYWAIFGTILMNLIAFIKARDNPHLDRVKGNLEGLYGAVKRDKSTIHGFWK
jgi:glycosyltransferase involved in cell wall biosynthesis